VIDSGAHFFKTDLQVHTPRDPAWSGKRPVSDGERAAYAEAFVAACRERGLQAVAVTDHHDFAFVDHIRSAALQEAGADGKPLPASQRLVVFPGLELTLPVPCQALLIFSADFPSERLPAVLNALAIEPAEDSAEKAKVPEQLAVDLKALHDRLDETSWLRGQYIVFPNVTDGGYRTLIRSGMRQPYREMPCVGGYIDGGAAIGDGNRRIFAGEGQNWGNKRVAVIRTSDSRAESFEKLGVHPTWIKWAEPTAEALRQACLAEESRITVEAPRLPSVVVTRLSVSNSRFMGPVDLNLNPQYNALIGGRGTGKSTCLEYLRWALCDQQRPRDLESSELPDHAARRGRLVEQTLKPVDGQVEVEFLLSGTPHLVRRYASTGEVMLKVGEAELTTATPEDVRSLLPIEAYSQRQLSSIGVRESELTRFVTAPLRTQLDAIGVETDQTAVKIRENHARLSRFRDLQRDIAKQAFRRQSIDQRVLAVREELKGLSADDRKTLDDKPRFDRTSQLRDSWLARLERARDAADAAEAEVAAAKDGLRTMPDRAEVAEPDLTSALAREIEGALDEAGRRAAELTAALEAATAFGAPTTKARDALTAQINAFAKEYEEARGRSTAEQSKLEELAKLENEQRELVVALETKQDEATQYGDVDEQHRTLRAEWRSTRKKVADLIAGQCKELTSLSDGRIRATLRVGAGMDEMADRFKTAISGSGVRGAKIEDFFAAITAADDPLAALHEALDELDRIVAAVHDDAQWDDPTTALSSIGRGDLSKATAKISVGDLLELSLMVPRDIPTFEYETKEGEYIAFADASAGQQATALLHVLLNQEGPPLVIDQPEDDLDSQVVLDVVDQIWHAKTQRQLIFASHNANLVVNGDAELVACCDYRTSGDHSGGRIKLSGAIDVKDVRDEITAVMEGGERAFKLRKEKYGF
jgi:type III restriction enzyme